MRCLMLQVTGSVMQAAKSKKRRIELSTELALLHAFIDTILVPSQRVFYLPGLQRGHHQT